MYCVHFLLLLTKTTIYTHYFLNIISIVFFLSYSAALLFLSYSASTLSLSLSKIPLNNIYLKQATIIARLCVHLYASLCLVVHVHVHVYTYVQLMHIFRVCVFALWNSISAFTHSYNRPTLPLFMTLTPTLSLFSYYTTSIFSLSQASYLIPPLSLSLVLLRLLSLLLSHTFVVTFCQSARLLISLPSSGGL